MTYRHLAKVARLIKKFSDAGCPVKGLNAQNRKRVQTSVNVVLNSAREVLKGLERAFVDYPLIFELTEANSVFLYLHYLDEKKEGGLVVEHALPRPVRDKWPSLNYLDFMVDYRLDYGKEVDPTRISVLNNISVVGEICSDYMAHSSMRTTRENAMIYNRALPWVYAINRKEFAGEESGGIYGFKIKYEPKYENANVANAVYAGKIYIKENNLRRDLANSLQRIREDSMLRQALAGQFGADEFNRWHYKAQNLVPDTILNPSWCDEVQDVLHDKLSQNILEKVVEWQQGESGRIKGVVAAIVTELQNRQHAKGIIDKITTTNNSKGAESFYVCINSCISVDDRVSGMKAKLLGDMMNRRLDPATAETLRIRGEAMVSEWLEMLSRGHGSLNDKVKYMEDKILPMWNKCQGTRKKISSWDE